MGGFGFYANTTPFYIRAWASSDLGTCRGPGTNPPPDTEGGLCPHALLCASCHFLPFCIFFHSCMEGERERQSGRAETSAGYRARITRDVLPYQSYKNWCSVTSLARLMQAVSMGPISHLNCLIFAQRQCNMPITLLIRRLQRSHRKEKMATFFQIFFQ